MGWVYQFEIKSFMFSLIGLNRIILMYFKLLEKHCRNFLVLEKQYCNNGI